MVHVYDRTGREVGRLAPPVTARIHWDPLYLAMGLDGTLHVSDLRYGAVHQFAPDGGYLGTLRPQGLDGDRWFPAAMAFDTAGSLYVTDFSPGRHRVLVLDGSGKVMEQFGHEGKDEGELSFPNGLAVDESGLVYVSDSNNGRLQTVDRQTGALSDLEYVQGLSLPRGMAIVGDRLYLADTVGQTVLAYALEGAGRLRFLYKLGDEGLADGQFRFPEGLAADRTGRIFVADRANNRIQVFGNP